MMPVNSPPPRSPPFLSHLHYRSKGSFGVSQVPNFQMQMVLCLFTGTPLSCGPVHLSVSTYLLVVQP